VLAVELAEPFFLAEPVELGRDDRGGVLVGQPSRQGRKAHESALCVVSVDLITNLFSFEVPA
jgi:hypothetical protein